MVLMNDFGAMDFIPPSEYARSLRPYFQASLAFLALIVVGKFMISDWWGGISLILIVIMGLLVLVDDMGLNASNALLFSMMAVLSGIFDVIACVLYFQHSKYEPFDSKAPNIVIFAQCIFIISPIALFMSATVAYLIFADFRDQAEQMPIMERGFRDPYDDQFRGGARPGPWDRPPGRPDAGQDLGGGRGGGEAPQAPPAGAAPPQPFQGRGQRLGG